MFWQHPPQTRKSKIDLHRPNIHFTHTPLRFNDLVYPLRELQRKQTQLSLGLPARLQASPLTAVCFRSSFAKWGKDFPPGRRGFNARQFFARLRPLAQANYRERGRRSAGAASSASRFARRGVGYGAGRTEGLSLLTAPYVLPYYGRSRGAG